MEYSVGQTVRHAQGQKDHTKVKALYLPAFTSAFSLLHTPLFDLTHSTHSITLLTACLQSSMISASGLNS